MTLKAPIRGRALVACVGLSLACGNLDPPRATVVAIPVESLTAYYKAQNLPAGDAKTPDEQLAVLQKREPVPEPRVQELLERRLAAAREALVKTEGIAAERLAAREAARESATSGQGRVEFAIAGAE